jgi:hypothetical protein
VGLSCGLRLLGLKLEFYHWIDTAGVHRCAQIVPIQDIGRSVLLLACKHFVCRGLTWLTCHFFCFCFITHQIDGLTNRQWAVRACSLQTLASCGRICLAADTQELGHDTIIWFTWPAGVWWFIRLKNHQSLFETLMDWVPVPFVHCQDHFVKRLLRKSITLLKP